MKSKSVFIIFFFFASVSNANICSEQKCPNGREATSICFNHPDVATGLFKAQSAAVCGYFTEIVTTGDISTIKSTLARLAKSCKTLDRLTLFGHGEDGYLQTGHLNSGSIRDLSEYSCLFNKDAKVQFYGCNVGRGCSGDMLMYQTGRSLLENGGTVTAPTFYIATILPGVIPNFSYNGKSRKLTYTPAKNPPDAWTQTGFALTDGGGINERCSENLKSLIDDYTENRSLAKKKKCFPSYDYINEDRLGSYKQMQKKLSSNPLYLQSANSETWFDLSSAISNLKTQTERYQHCEPAESDRNSSKSSGAVR